MSVEYVSYLFGKNIFVININILLMYKYMSFHTVKPTKVLECVAREEHNKCTTCLQ